MSLPRHLKISLIGFSLIELMVAITIIAIISAAGFTSYSQAQKLARDSKRKQDLQAISKALELFYADNRRYPCSGTSPKFWITSGDNGWLTDSSAGVCQGLNQNIAPTYISTLPKDPSGINVLNPWLAQGGYGYFSMDGVWPDANGCAKGTYYILVTQLENANDPDTLGKKPGQRHPVCNSALTVGAFAATSYIITIP